MKADPPPFPVLVYVCTNARPSGERVSCAAAGRDGLRLKDELKRLVKEGGWSDRIRICSSGCMDRCEEGPNAVRLGASGNEWISHLATGDLPALVERLAQNLP